MRRPTEQWIIRRVAERFGASNGVATFGIGDDAAVLGGPEGPRSLLTTDTLIEGVHFDLTYMSLADVGYKALAVNLSDINAMGGESTFALGTLGVPRGATEADIESLLDGIEAALELCRAAGQQCSLIGGDTVASPQWMIGFTVLGKVEGAPLLRSGARPGDIVWHSGRLGLSGVEFEQLRRGSGISPIAREAHLRPVPPLSFGTWLQRNGYATAAQDLSDSLSQVALQLASASGVGVELDFRGYEFAPEVAEFAMSLDQSAADCLLAQAEDYQLLFTTPPELAEQIASAPMLCTRLGHVVESGRSYLDEHGVLRELKAVGFQHF